MPATVPTLPGAAAAGLAAIDAAPAHVRRAVQDRPLVSDSPTATIGGVVQLQRTSTKPACQIDTDKTCLLNSMMCC